MSRKTVKFIQDELEVKYRFTKKMKIPIELKNYKIEKIILEYPGHCTVVSSTSPLTKEKVAIKCIPVNLLSDDTKETDLMVELDHPNVIKYYESFYYPTKKPRFYAIVMSRAVCDLLLYMESSYPFKEKLMCSIMKQSLNGILYLHKEAIFHRDIKPDNILIMEECREGVKVAITDFGLSVKVQSETYTGECTGSLPYAAPELLEYTEGKLRYKEEATYTNKIDSWSMGIVLYCMISYLCPFSPSSKKDIERLFKGNPALDPDDDDNPMIQNELMKFRSVSEECKDLIRSLLCADPDKRMSVEQALNHPWFNLFENENENEKEKTEKNEVKKIFDTIDEDINTINDG